MIIQLPLRTTTLRQEVARALREEILSGRLLPGEKLVEAPLASRLGVSRIPIREAIAHLEQQGLVTSIPNRGTYVMKLDHKQLQDALIVRAHLELLAVRLIMTDPDPRADRFDRLAEIVVAMQKLADAVTQPSDETYGRINLLDADFHQCLFECSCNEALQRTWSGVAPVDLVFAHEIAVILEEGPTRARLVSDAEYHSRLLESLRSGDSHIAEAEIKKHFISPSRADTTSLTEASLSLLGWK